jgi:small subunit ribosomal protein S20
VKVTFDNPTSLWYNNARYGTIARSGKIGYWRNEALPNTKSAAKALRQNEKRRERNWVHRGRARTAVKKARLAMVSGDVEMAREAIRQAASMLDRAAQKGTIHPRNAARRKSRLMKQMAQLEARESAE